MKLYATLYGNDAGTAWDLHLAQDDGPERYQAGGFANLAVALEYLLAKVGTDVLAGVRTYTAVQWAAEVQKQMAEGR